MTAPNPVSVYGPDSAKGLAAEESRNTVRLAKMAEVEAKIKAQLAGTTVAP